MTSMLVETDRASEMRLLLWHRVSYASSCCFRGHCRDRQDDVGLASYSAICRHFSNHFLRLGIIVWDDEVVMAGSEGGCWMPFGRVSDVSLVKGSPEWARCWLHC